MKRIFILVFLVACISGYSQDWAAGLRLGDPSGITVKKYFGDNAFELSIGRTHIGRGPKYYNDHFYKWYDKKKFNYYNYDYLRYDASIPIAIQLHYLFQRSIGSVAGEETPGLGWYFGLGGQFRFQNYYYTYRYRTNPGDPDWIYTYDERVTDLDLGVDFVIGLEYKFREVPLSVFGDLNLFMEVVDAPFFFWFQGGVGVRYHF